MFAVRNHDYDCTRKCRLRQHGNEITAALTKRSISDENLAAFVAKICCNFCDISDDLGRTAVHLSASVGRYAVLEWLLNHGATINGRDYESGSSPLHRSLYYGAIDCSILLIRYGASMELLDEDTRCPLQSICRMCDFQRNTIGPQNDILVWGSNKNYNLGIATEEIVNRPQSLDFFRKANISIESVALGAYHSLYLDKKSQLYAVGHGKGGRLGIGIENSLPVPKKVKVPIKNAGEIIICISVSRKHSLLLTNRSVVYASGLNEDQQLGVRDAGEKLLTFKEVISLRDNNVTDLLRVIARDQYSVAYSSKAVYVWGANVGQFGIGSSTKYIAVPMMVKLPPRTNIQFVETNNAAIVIYTMDNLILLYYNDKLKTIKTPNYEALKIVSIVGGDSKHSANGTASALKLLLLTKSNVVFLWYENTQNFYRCGFSHIRLSQIDKIYFKSNQVFILSQGDVYRGKSHQISLPAFVQNYTSKSIDIWQNNDQNRTEISKDHMIRIDLQRIANVDRVVDIFCDDDFSAFAVLQESHMKYFKTPTLTAVEYNFKKLYHDVSDADAVHDIIFHVDSETYAAHRLIIYARAPGLKDIIIPYQDKNIFLSLPNLTGKMFEVILKYIYTNYFPKEEDLEAIHQSFGPDSPENLLKTCDLFLGFVNIFRLIDLENYVKSYLIEQYFALPEKSKFRFNRLRRGDFPELYDVRIICEGEIELQAHKCILVARLEYFDMMFTHSWAEHTTINLNTMPIEYMEPIINFLYSGDVEHFRKQNYSETYLYNMVVFCDQFFIERLQKVCEILILDKINIRKCGEMFDFACTYNCQLLKSGCMEYICQNLARVLSYKSLDQCDPDALKCLNQHYKNLFRDVFDYRMITPDSEAIEDELLLSFIDGFHVDLNYRIDIEAQQKTTAKQKQKELKSNARQYERNAISDMMHSISLNQAMAQSPPEKSKILEEAQQISAQLQSESKHWMKVVDKKEQKKKHSEPVAKINTIVKHMEKTTPDFETMSKTAEKESLPATPTTPNITSTPNRGYDFNLLDLTPQREKLSQKQRKRLSSESKSISTSGSWRSPQTQIAIPATPVAVPNAWGTVPQTPPSSITETLFASPPATGSASDPSSFANMMRSPSISSSGGAADTSNNSFSKILADERRQREYYDRMRNKSLVLTQIEETAISELREFYNVDNVTDEIITIERKSMPRTMNFVAWHRN